MNELTCCPYCGERVSDATVRLWDGRWYCQSCVNEVSPELYEFARNGGQLVDVVEKSDVSIQNLFHGAGIKTVMVAFLIFMLPFFVLAILDPVNARFDLLLGVCFFWDGFLIGYLILKGLLTLSLFSLPRRVTVEQNQLRISTPRDELEFSLNECRWKFGWVTNDGLATFTGLQKGILIDTSNGFISCGHSPEMLKHWGAFLLLAGVRRKSYWAGLRTSMISIAGLLIGFLLGYFLGQIVALMTNDPFWKFAIAFLGCLDGGGIAFNYAYYTNYGRQAAHHRMSPPVWGAIFFAVAFKIFLVRGMGMVLLCGVINGVIGALAAWSIRCYFCADDDQQRDEKQKQRDVKEVLGHEH